MKLNMEKIINKLVTNALNDADKIKIFLCTCVCVIVVAVVDCTWMNVVDTDKSTHHNTLINVHCFLGISITVKVNR